ncbi:MAG: glutaminyl-peptide cyclotransferase [bacterium]|nr:glutaminyl-peptide cyclotransferase [bacterium]
MKRIRSAAIFTTFVICFISSCNFINKNSTPETGESSELDYSISNSDTSINLQFYNGRLGDLKIQGILLNQKSVKYNQVNEDLLRITHDTLLPGKNEFVFIFSKENKTDSIKKTYFYLVNIDFIVNNTFEHNRTYFTEGLFFDSNGNLVESTGLENNSKVLFYTQGSKGFKVKDSITNQSNEFGEGVSIINNQLVQLLWKNKYLKIYNSSNHQFIRNMGYDSEGWGLCTNGSELFASNGSNVINKLDISGNFVTTKGTINVQDENGPVSNLNELEWINGYIYANVWQTNLIYIIDPGNGYVVSKIDLGILVDKEKKQSDYIDVLNGITWNKSNSTLLVTGKYWQNFYELKLSKVLSKKSNSEIAIP